MLHTKCYIQNAIYEMLHTECYIRNANEKCYIPRTGLKVCVVVVCGVKTHFKDQILAKIKAFWLRIFANLINRIHNKVGWAGPHSSFPLNSGSTMGTLAQLRVYVRWPKLRIIKPSEDGSRWEPGIAELVNHALTIIGQTPYFHVYMYIESVPRVLKCFWLIFGKVCERGPKFMQ